MYKGGGGGEGYWFRGSQTGFYRPETVWHEKSFKNQINCNANNN